MDVFTQRLPYEGFAKRTITLEQDKLVIDYKNIARSLTDDYSYGKIDPFSRPSGVVRLNGVPSSTAL